MKAVITWIEPRQNREYHIEIGFDPRTYEWWVDHVKAVCVPGHGEHAFPLSSSEPIELACRQRFEAWMIENERGADVLAEEAMAAAMYGKVTWI